jgi:hypothetical protein
LFRIEAHGSAAKRSPYQGPSPEHFNHPHSKTFINVSKSVRNQVHVSQWVTLLELFDRPGSIENARVLQWKGHLTRQQQLTLSSFLGMKGAGRTQLGL